MECDEPSRHRKNIAYRSLRKSAGQVMQNVKKKLSRAEQSVRNRRALQPLNESLSTSPVTSQMNIVVPHHTHGKDVNSMTAGIFDLEGYKFDSESNILQTPEHTQSPPIHRRKTARLRGFVLRRSFKNPANSSLYSAEGRLAKQKARVKIREIQLPKLPGDPSNSLSLPTFKSKRELPTIGEPCMLEMGSRDLFVKRPTPNETEDDILAMQMDWEANTLRHNRPAVQIHRLNKPSASSTPGEANSKPQSEGTATKRRFTGASFFIDLDQIEEECSNQVLFDVEERNMDWLEYDHSDELARQGCQKSQYSMDDGFPEVLDLSAYYKKDAPVKRTSEGKSFFAAEFDRLHGEIKEAVSLLDNETQSEEDDYKLENDRYLASLDQEKINELRKEVSEKLAPDLVNFLKHRYRETSKTTEENKTRVSKFKSSREPKLESTESSSTNSSAPSSHAPVLNDMLDRLEVMDEFGDLSDREKYNRLATDAVQLDFVTKCMRSVGSRQQKNALKLFDNCKIAPPGCTDKLLQLARSRIDDIKELYLEEIKSEGKTFFQFANGVNPLVDGSWMLVPIRRVLDTIHDRQVLGDASEASQDDVEIVRLTLLWTVLLHEEKPTAFFAFASPNDIYVRLAEVLLIGPNVLADDIIAACYSRILTRYILKAAVDGRLRLCMESRIAELDAFMPFFEDLLAHFEQYSMGDVGFTRTLLIGSYLNSAITDSMECRFALWSPKRNSARQMTIKMNEAADIMGRIRVLSNQQASELEEQHYVQYTSLLGAYAASIRDEKDGKVMVLARPPGRNIEFLSLAGADEGCSLALHRKLTSKTTTQPQWGGEPLVTRDRNPLMFAIAAEELGSFVRRHSHQESLTDESKTKEFDALVEIVRGTVQGKLQL